MRKTTNHESLTFSQKNLWFPGNLPLGGANAGNVNEYCTVCVHSLSDIIQFEVNMAAANLPNGRGRFRVSLQYTATIDPR
jgi:hypothetical protein